MPYALSLEIMYLFKWKALNKNTTDYIKKYKQ